MRAKAMRVSCVQLDMKLGDVKANFAHAEAMIREAVNRDHPDTVVLPETWNTGFFPQELAPCADDDGKATKALCSALAKELHINIVAGSVANRRADGYYNTAYVFDRSGALTASYDKIHAFTPMGEQLAFAQGDALCRFSLEGHDCGLIICYDIRFPELARTQVLGGADILFVMACFPGGDALPPRTDHWDLLIDAMALQNQTWVCAANQYGSICGGREHPFGRSRITDPWGTPVAVAGNHKDIIWARLDLDFAETCKRSIGGLHNRRVELYQI